MLHNTPCANMRWMGAYHICWWYTATNVASLFYKNQWTSEWKLENRKKNQENDRKFNIFMKTNVECLKIYNVYNDTIESDNIIGLC